MTISSEVYKSGPYNGNDVTTTFAYGFKVYADTELEVILTSVAGVETTLTLSTHYTVSGVGADAGGNVTYPVSGSPLATGEKLTIRRKNPLTQLTDLRNQGAFLSETIEKQLDRLIMIVQQQDEKIERSLFLSASTLYSELTVPDPVANNFLQWKTDLSGLQNASSVYGTVTVNTTAPLTGGGQLNTDRTLGISAASGGAAGSMSAAHYTKLEGIEASADVTDATNVNAAGAVMHSDVTQSDGLLRKIGSETYTALKINTSATGAPTVNDDSSQGYGVGSDWVDVTNDNIYKCADASVGAAVWVATGASAGGVISVGATAPITSSGGTNPTIAINPASGIASGSMSAADYNKLDITTLGTVEASKTVTADSNGNLTFNNASVSHQINFVGSTYTCLLYALPSGTVGIYDVNNATWAQYYDPSAQVTTFISPISASGGVTGNVTGDVKAADGTTVLDPGAVGSDGTIILGTVTSSSVSSAKGGASGRAITATSTRTSGLNSEAIYASIPNADSATIKALNTASTGTQAAVSGASSSASGYDFYAAGTGINYGPFTGGHDGLMGKNSDICAGDIVVDDFIINKKNISNTIAVNKKSSSCNEPAIGVFVASSELVEDNLPAALVDYHGDLSLYNRIVFNALGEGQINVCGEGGNINNGDLIVTSSIPGKGMKQTDDIVRSYTVAKAREAVSFNSQTEIKQIACIYLCG